MHLTKSICLCYDAKVNAFFHTVISIEKKNSNNNNNTYIATWLSLGLPALTTVLNSFFRFSCEANAEMFNIIHTVR